MNIWIKSLLIGIAAAIAAYFISEEKNSKLKSKRYTIGCTIKAEPDTAVRTPFSLSRIMEALENTLKAADYNYEIKKEDERNITVSLSGMTDTVSPFSMLISNGRVQFREMYRIDDAKVRPMLMAAVEEMNKTKAVAEKKVVAPAKKRDSMSKDVSALLDSMEMKSNTEKHVEATMDLIQFSQVFSIESMPAAIGMLKLKDTAAVRNLFNLDSVKMKSPPDLQLCFGEIEKIKNGKKEELMVSLYFIKTYGNEKALLENEDISDARAEFSRDGNAQVTLQFNQYGTTKWANLTQKNIGRPLAIIVNNKVISAPNVISAIPNGYSTISGGFSYDECKLLSISLKSNKLPAKLSIISSSVKEDKSDYDRNRKLLVALISFLVAGSIAFFTFKALKAT